MSEEANYSFLIFISFTKQVAYSLPLQLHAPFLT